jgi:RNA polymerase sigma-70 factor (ECF subfamily)
LAEDASQEAFMAAFSKLGTYQPDRRFAPWMLTIATRVSYNLIRSRQRMRQHEGEIQPAVAKDAASAPLEMRESLASLKAAIDELPERDAIALHLRFRQGLANDEIAEALELPPGTVRVVLCRALAKLHSRLDRELIR